MTILDNELVKKYFGGIGGYLDCEMALRILEAMEQDIKEGETCLQIAGQNVHETQAQFDMDHTFHSRRNFLKLPSRFQPQKAVEKCTEHTDRNGPYCTRCGVHLGNHPTSKNPPPPLPQVEAIGEHPVRLGERELVDD